MRDAWLDLLLGSSCGVCGLPGRVLCDLCAWGLPRSARVAWPTPCPPGLALPLAAGEYDGGLKILVNAHKERRQFSLAGPLGEVLAHAVRAVLDHQGNETTRTCLLVPVPSRAPVVRARGHDPMLRVTRNAAGLLRRWGYPVTVRRLLSNTTVAQDQTGLGAWERAENLAGSMRCPLAAGIPHHARDRARSTATQVVITDDVLTTGATAREAQRALEEAALLVVGIATVAATRKRLRPAHVTSDSGGSLPFFAAGD